MKYLSYFAFISTSLAMVGCDGKAANYDKGYKAAWEEEEAPSSFLASTEEKEGYEAGLQDAWIYDTGYSDGYEGEKPEYFNDLLYMDAYKDGKKDKEKRW